MFLLEQRKGSNAPLSIYNFRIVHPIFSILSHNVQEGYLSRTDFFWNVLSRFFI
jgi:hypothetical protein